MITVYRLPAARRSNQNTKIMTSKYSLIFNSLRDEMLRTSRENATNNVAVKINKTVQAVIVHEETAANLRQRQITGIYELYNDDATTRMLCLKF